MVVTLSFPLERETHLQNPIFDGLYCEDESPDDVFGGGLGSGDQNEDFDDKKHERKNVKLLENDLFWEDDELVSLLAKEKEVHLGYDQNLDSDEGFFMVSRKKAVVWILRVTAYYGFTPMTGVLAVGYYDRFMSSLCLQRDKPWMSQLAAVACLSIAAKMEEIQVPLLLDLQVADAKFVFEAKTIKRMELLVLSSLGWRMKLVTPLSFLDHIVRRFDLLASLNWEFLRNFERVILSIISDSKFFHYLPSVIATAAFLFVSKDLEPCELMQYQNQFMDVTKVSKDKVNECYKLILELMEDQDQMQLNITRKRKYPSIPASPNGVIDAYFSCDSSNDSWDVALSAPLSSSPMPLFKRSRVQNRTNDAIASICGVSLIADISP